MKTIRFLMLKQAINAIKLSLVLFGYKQYNFMNPSPGTGMGHCCVAHLYGWIRCAAFPTM